MTPGTRTPTHLSRATDSTWPLWILGQGHTNTQREPEGTLLSDSLSAGGATRRRAGATSSCGRVTPRMPGPSPDRSSGATGRRGAWGSVLSLSGSGTGPPMPGGGVVWSGRFRRLRPERDAGCCRLQWESGSASSGRARRGVRPRGRTPCQGTSYPPVSARSSASVKTSWPSAPMRTAWPFTTNTTFSPIAR